MATNVGKVGIVMKGTWSSSDTYEVLDAVTYSGSLYIAKQNVPAGTTPTNTTYWQLATDLTAKADKVSGAVTNHLAAFDATGNLIDSEILVTESKRVTASFSLSNTDQVNVRTSTVGRAFLLMIRGQQSGTQIYGAFIVIGYNGGYNRNKIITIEKGTSIDTVAFADNQASNKTLEIKFTGTFSDIGVDFILIPYADATYTIEKAV